MTSIIDRLGFRESKMYRQEILLLILYTITIVALGILLANDYGQTWDDAAEAFYGRVVSKAYEGSEEYYKYQFQSYFGSSYYLVQYQAVELIQSLFPSWLTVHIRYFVNFITFQLGVISIYILLRKLFSRSISFVISALFFSQPIIFGASFINHKDAIFLSFFSLALATGLSMVDVLYESEERLSFEKSKDLHEGEYPSFFSLLKADWRRAEDKMRCLLIASSFILVIAVIALFQTAIIYQPLMDVVEHAYNGDSFPIVNRIFDLVAENKRLIPVDDYIAKTGRIFSFVRSLLISFLIIPLFLLSRKIFQSAKTRIKFKLPALVMISALSLGLASGLRIAGPFAGLLVSLYLIMKSKSIKNLIVLLPYWGLGYLATYALWPALWVNPIGHIVETLEVMYQFPLHDVRYLGNIYPSNNLPWHFFPVLLLLELTEPQVVLTLFGLLLMGLTFVEKSRSQKIFLVIVILWFFIPFVGNVFMRLSNYGNFRHYLFAIPPLFIFAGVAYEWLLKIFRGKGVKVLITAVILVPGIASIANLHPYEYIYFNQFIGGVDNAQGVFELDYWCTSYKEAMEFVNSEAALDARVVAWGPVQAARTFARSDLIVLSEGEIGPGPDYAIACNAALYNDNYYRGYDVQYEVRTAGAVLGRVKQRPQSSRVE